MLTFLQKQFFLLRCHFNFKLQLFWPKHGFIFYIFGRFAGLLFLVCCVIVSYIFFSYIIVGYFLVCYIFGLLYFWFVIFLVCYFLYFLSVVLLSVICLSVILFFDYVCSDISVGYYILVCYTFGLLQFCSVIFLPPFDQHYQPMIPPTEGGQVT